LLASSSRRPKNWSPRGNRNRISRSISMRKTPARQGCGDDPISRQRGVKDSCAQYEEVFTLWVTQKLLWAVAFGAPQCIVLQTGISCFTCHDNELASCQCFADLSRGKRLL
jgi:hypothetical protein